MKKFIYNTKNQILGVEYNNTKLFKINPLSAAKETGELLRLACWYHNSIRQHYNYSL